MVYSDTAGDSVTVGGRTATRNSSEPVIWIAHAWPDSAYFGWMCVGLSESAVKLTTKTEYADSVIYKIASHGVVYYVASMSSQVKFDSESTMCVKTSRFTVNVPAIESTLFRYYFQSTDYTDDSFFDKIVTVSHRNVIEEGLNVSCIKSIQHGSFTTEGKQTLEIVSVEIKRVNPYKSFVILNTVNTNTYDPNQCGHAALWSINYTTMDIEVQSPSTYTTFISWQLIEFA